MFRKPYLFSGKDLDDQLVKTVRVLGSQELKRFIKENKIKIQPEHTALLENNLNSEYHWETLIKRHNISLYNVDGLDLMKKMMFSSPSLHRKKQNLCR